MSEPPCTIYLGYNASTPIDPRVAAVMRPLLEGMFANPSATHPGGRTARALLDRARAQVAELLGCGPDEIVFTSGGSEADNLALKGIFFALRERGDHIITTAVEHPAILEPLRFLERLGARVTVIPVDRAGLIDPEDVRRAITPRTILVSVMLANNEVGTIEPVAAVATIAHERGVLVHTDAAQTVGKIRTRVDELGVDLLSIAGHKLYAPKGVGALYVRRGVALEPLIHGASHEAGRRAGTESGLLAAALGEACELAADLRPLGETAACETTSGMASTLASATASSSTAIQPNDCRTPSTSVGPGTASRYPRSLMVTERMRCTERLSAGGSGARVQGVLAANYAGRSPHPAAWCRLRGYH